MPESLQTGGTDSGTDSVITFKVTDRYLNIPVCNSAPIGVMTFSAENMENLENNVKISGQESPDEYWVFYDMSAYKGKTITISYSGNRAALERIYMSEEIRDCETFYKESGRPQQHFTFRRGWNNDPNGLIYYKGEYHLFGQHNPFENNWNNMHWGHAVSTDLVHWTELPEALAPDRLGTIYSGTATIDKDNTSGLGKKGKAPMVALFTSAGKSRTQSLAYSLDNGRSWTKYEGNPVLDTRDDSRDPKVFWYPEGGHWVMVLYQNDGHSIYTSDNLKEWKFQSHLAGFYECPDMYRLPVDGDPSNTKWVLSSASGMYMIGDFDGKTFTPETSFQRYCHGIAYAGQTFNNMPDGRIVQIAWLTTDYPGMPFRSCFSTPLEMSLKTTKDGVRLFAEPVKEFEVLQHLAYEGSGLNADKATEVLSRFNENDHLRIRFTISTPTSCLDFGIKFGGQNVFQFVPGMSMVNGQFVPTAFGDKVELSVDIIADKGMFEVYVNGGAFCEFVRKLPADKNGYSAFGAIRIDNLQIYTLDSIWDR